MSNAFIGEHLFYGSLGHFLVVLAFVASALCAWSYYLSVKSAAPEKNSWKSIARISFGIHALSVFGILGILIFIINSHYFEYYYVWQHSSMSLATQYIFSCLWEGQEGSFLLWIFWHVILGFILIRTSGEWESGVLSIICLVQVFLCSMILGIVIGDYKIGSNPFILLRDHPDMANLPFVKNPNYLSLIKDGRGLNPLLQNYWMTIHPPTLFLGFASTVIPFAYVITALITKKYSEWIKPALPWTFFSVMVLGTGILMGAAWAYEALSFGGFWAWDPVENASLVPWITLVAAAHVMLIQKNNQHSLITAFILVISTFILILYSTFLTRSGILGDTSVHAFTDLGMSGQLIFYMGFFVVLSLFLLVKNWKRIPKSQHEEHTYSREFWMFIGVLVLVISALQIFLSTSKPVINKIFSTNLAPPVDVIRSYHAWQIPIAIIICFLIAVTQYFKYKQTDIRDFLRKVGLSLLFSVALSVPIIVALEFYSFHYGLLLFASLFAIIANFNYLLIILKGKIRHSGASIAHIGFGLILLGALIANSKSRIISNTSSNINLGKDFPNNENILLHKFDTLVMGEYYVTYKGKKKEGVNIYYEIEYFQPNSKTGKLEKKFSLKPVVQTNPRMGNVSEPDTKHFITKDIYTHVTYADLEEMKEQGSQGDYKKPQTNSIAVGDTIATSNSLIILQALNRNINKESLQLTENDIAVGAKLKIIDINKKEYDAEPVFIVKENMIHSLEDTISDLGLKIAFNKISPETAKISLVISEKKTNIKEFIIMKAVIFPYINVLWIGCILLIFGIIVAIRQRIIKNNAAT